MPEVILPALPPLTPDAKQKLILIADIYAKAHRENILHFLETGEVKIDELPLLDRVPEIKDWLIQEYNAWLYPADPQPEAVAIDKEYADWESVKGERSLEGVFRYLNSHPSGAFYDEARALLKELKGERLKEIKAHLGQYSLHDYNEWTAAGGIFTEADFIAAGIVTKESLDALRVPVTERDLNLSKTNYDCPAGCTDVYFLGIPSTGKTCILMGLLNTFGGYLEWDCVRFGGDYGCALQKLCDKWVTPMSTSGDFATLFTGAITDYQDENIIHPVNLIELAGTTFTEMIAGRSAASLAIADWGEGIPQMLSNPNDKIFFFVIDPTCDETKYRKRVEVDGREEMVEIVVPQSQTINKFCEILSARENTAIMRKVKGMHIVVTKADCLGPKEVREDAAARIVKEKYAQSVSILNALCHSSRFDLNASSNHEVRVFPFSLGTFYLGNSFKYDPTDSEALLKVISKLSAGRKGYMTFWERIRVFFSK